MHAGGGQIVFEVNYHVCDSEKVGMPVPCFFLLIVILKRRHAVASIAASLLPTPLLGGNPPQMRTL